MENCVFCKIIEGEIPSAKIWENNEFIAILDINPNTKGMALVLSKKHYDSYAFDMPEADYLKLMLASKEAARLLEKALQVHRVAMVMEGMGVNHVHVKLYPLHGVDKEFKEVWASEKVFFKKYDGYISTQLGPTADIAELSRLAEKIRNSAD